MGKIFLIVFQIVTPAFAAPSLEMEARATVRRMISDLKGAGTFRTSGCPRVPTEKWARFLFLNEPVRHSLRFAPACDVQADLVITRGQFPVDLKIRNAHGVERLRALVNTEIDPEVLNGQVVVRARATQASAQEGTNDELLAFSAHYEVVTGLDARVKENRGGTVRVSRFQEKPLMISEHFQIN